MKCREEYIAPFAVQQAQDMDLQIGWLGSEGIGEINTILHLGKAYAKELNQEKENNAQLSQFKKLMKFREI